MIDLPAPLEPIPPASVTGGSSAGVEAARARLRELGVEPSTWSNAPGDTYAAHDHAWTKLLVCAEGGITFFVGEDATPVPLRPGDGFVLPPRTRHSAEVGPEGCVCVEGHRG